jgi:hypothetical protein
MIVTAQRIHWANSGAPMGRLRRQPLYGDLFRDGDDFKGIHRVMRVGIIFRTGQCPLQFMLEVLQKHGFETPEQLRDAFDHPRRRLMARPHPEAAQFRSLPIPDVLRHALILGLSTTSIYDPSRPVVWTRASLTRRLELYDPEGFYQ